VVKQYVRQRGVGIERRLVQGTATTVAQLLERTQGGGVLNTSFIEPLNGTFRSRQVWLERRTWHGARQRRQLHAVMHLVGTVYNFCTPHASLQTPEGRNRTPAMAAGLTDQCWSVGRLLHYQVSPARMKPREWVSPAEAS
jgi:hypothetical protein